MRLSIRRTTLQNLFNLRLKRLIEAGGRLFGTPLNPLALLRLAFGTLIDVPVPGIFLIE